MISAVASDPVGQAITSPIVQRLGQWLAYAMIPLSLVRGNPYAPQNPYFIVIYALAALGIVAMLRGATMPRLLMRGGYLLLAGYIILLVMELANGDLGRTPRPLGSGFFTTYFVFLCFPFVAIALREVGIDRRLFDLTIAVTLPVAAVWSLWQFAFMNVIRPEGFLGLNTIHFGLFAGIWGLLLFSRALQAGKIDVLKLALALTGLIPVILSASKLAWFCIGVGYIVLIVWWAVDGRHWRSLAIVALAVVIVGVAVFSTPALRQRILTASSEVTVFVETGETDAGSFGLRYAAAKSGILAFLDRPLLGYGLADVKIAALEHQPENVADISTLWHLHNDYIMHMVAFGLPGLVVLLSLVAFFLVAAYRCEDTTTRRWGLVVFAFFPIYMFAESAFGRSPVYGIMFFCCALTFVPWVEPKVRYLAKRRAARTA